MGDRLNDKKQSGNFWQQWMFRRCAIRVLQMGSVFQTDCSSLPRRKTGDIESNHVGTSLRWPQLIIRNQNWEEQGEPKFMQRYGKQGQTRLSRKKKKKKI